MASSEAFQETPKRSSSRRDLDQRRADRMAGKMNAPVRGARGLANIVAQMSGRVLHPIDCICNWCMPEDMRVVMLGPNHEALRTDHPARAPKEGPRWKAAPEEDVVAPVPPKEGR